MKQIIFLVASFLPLITYAQQQSSPVPISLQQAMDLAIKNRYDIQANKYNITLATNQVDKTKKEWVPDISASGNIRYSPQVQSTYIPGGFVGSAPALVSFGAKNITVFGLDLNQPIYNPGLHADLKIAQKQLEIASEKNKQDENNIREQVAQSYLNVLLRNLQRKISGDDQQRFKEYEEVAAGKLKLGTLIENDYLKARLDYENAKIQTTNAEQNYILAVEHFNYQLNVPAETRFTLTDTLNEGEFPVLLQDTAAVFNRTEIRQLTLQQQNEHLQLAKARQYALPTVSAYANYSQQFSYDNFNYSLGQWWSPFSYVGLKVSVPITGNLKNSRTIKQHQLESLQTDLDLKQKTADIDYEIKKAISELNNAKGNMEAAKNNYELSRVIYENQKQQYNLGTLLYSDLLNTDRSLNTTEQNYIKAVYDFLVAQINYQKAIGKY